MIFHHFENSRPLPSLGLGARMFTSKLRYAERRADVVLHCLWKGLQIFLAGTHQNSGLWPGTRFNVVIYLSQFGICRQALGSHLNSAVRPAVRSYALVSVPLILRVSPYCGTPQSALRGDQVGSITATLQRV